MRPVITFAYAQRVTVGSVFPAAAQLWGHGIRCRKAINSMIKLVLLAALFSLWGCKSTKGSLSSSSEFVKSDINDLSRIENDQVRKLWAEHVRSETVTLNTSGKDILEDCKPRFYPAKEGSPRQGMVMFFHGFTACPQQYFPIAELLAEKGFDVFLPLMPGQGRAATGKIDYLNDLPSKNTFAKPRKHERYTEFVEKMNAIAAASTGTKALAGLSGGGGLATGAALAGQSGNANIWTRLLLYAPYYLNSGLAKTLADTAGFFFPGVKSDWGEGCRVNRARPNGRAGYCSINAGATQAMVQFGEEVAQETDKILIPVQIAGVEEDPTADNSAMARAFRKMKNAKLCYYPLGVPHSLINPDKDLIPDKGFSEAKFGNPFPMCNPATLNP
jgi:alpha-beta hydrolase superfamily lysophospholipase